MSGNIQPVKPFEFDLSEEEGDSKITITIAGDKGEGKTMGFANFPGSKGAISLDHKTKVIDDILKGIVKRDVNMKVFDGLRYYTEDAGKVGNIVAAGHKTYMYIHALLDSMKGKYDWIVFDGMEKLHEICEMEMRNIHKIGATEGFANFNWWKDRRMSIRSLHNKAMTAANIGVIYTTYLEFVTEIVENEKTIQGKRHPKWVDVVMTETDVVMHAYATEDSSGKRRYYVKVKSSKRPTFIRDGCTVEVSGYNYTKLFEGGKLPVPKPNKAKKEPVIVYDGTGLAAIAVQEVEEPKQEETIELTSPVEPTNDDGTGNPF
jgi:hypothetical protein